MATAESLGSAYIDLSYKGFEALKSGMGQMKDNAKELGKSFDSMAGKATAAFASLSGTLLATTRAASPQVFDVFSGSLGALSKVIGATLAPVLIDLTTYVVQAIKWWAELDTGTKQNIQTFVKWGIVITGAIVAFNTLYSVFGGFTSAVIKFALANPLVTAFGAVVVLIGAAIMSIRKLEEHMDKTIAKAKRLAKGDIEEGDMTDETNRIKAIEDPKERAAEAQKLIDSETKRKNDALKHFNRPDAFGEVDTLRMGWQTLKGYAGLHNEADDLEKVQNSAGSNIGVATQIRDEALKGQEINVKKKPKGFDNPFGNIGDLGMQQKAVQVGGLTDLWKSIQQAQQEDPSEKWLKALGIKQDLNNELLKGVRDGIDRQNQAVGIPAIGGN